MTGGNEPPPTSPRQKSPGGVSGMTEGQSMYAYLKFMYARYEELSGFGDVWIELRCITPGKIKRQADTWYFRPNHQGFVDACWYIRENRESFDIYNKLVPSVQSDSGWTYPVVGMLWADLDGKGLADRFSQCERLLINAHLSHGLSLPHLCTKGRNGVHSYWATALEIIEEKESEQRFERLLKRLSLRINGDPDGEDKFGLPVWKGVSADLNLARIDATLRPVGSWNHKEQGDPVQVSLLYSSPGIELGHAEWHCSLPSLVDPFSMSSLERLGRKKESETGPMDRKRVPRRTIDFLMAGIDQDSIHEGLVHALSDLNWSNYTTDECQQLLLDCVGSTSSRRAKIIDAVKWAKRKYDNWNETPTGLTIKVTGDAKIEHV